MFKRSFPPFVKLKIFMDSIGIELMLNEDLPIISSWKTQDIYKKVTIVLSSKFTYSSIYGSVELFVKIFIWLEMAMTFRYNIGYILI